MRILTALAGLLLPVAAWSAGARSFKTGPVQITADGAHAWVVNPDNDSVAHVDTATEPAPGSVLEIPLPDAGVRHVPRNLAVTEDGREVWVACEASDRVVVLAGHGGPLPTGSLVARIDLPRGSAPWGVALSRDQSLALVTCLRSGRLVFVDVATHAIAHDLPTERTPLGACFLEDGASAWITHLRVNDRLTRLGRVDVSGTPRVTTLHRQDGTNPQLSGLLRDPDPSRNVAEGGYLHFRGHLAQRPGGGRPWVPTQYGNVHEDVVTPDSLVQATIRTVDLATRTLPNTLADKIILTARHVHDPVTGSWVGPGWDAPLAGPADVAFSADGQWAYVVGEQSENVLAFRTDTPAHAGTGAPAPVVVPVGWRPLGIAVSPVAARGYVANTLSRTISVLDLTPGSETELRQLSTIPVTGEQVDPATRNGEHLFYTSNDPRISGNRKVACASCHIFGEDDGRAWELQHLPGSHGPRQTQSLIGLSLSFGAVDSATGLGQLHASGDRDEVQDFDHTFVGQQMGGAGFLAAASRQPPLGAGPNAGLDADLDDLAAYVLQVPPILASPRRNADGSLTEAGVRGATFFVGAGASPGDGQCASCHVPETGFTDLSFHDVGQYRWPTENELNVRAPAWATNTPSLVGAWHSPPFVGAAQPVNPESLLELLLDMRRPGRLAPHGSVAGLTGRQLEDLAEFLEQVDGSMTPAEVRGAVDFAPPRVVRVAPTSTTRLEVFFSESVASSAASPLAWRVREVGGPDVVVTDATWDAARGDRVTLLLSGVVHGCRNPTYQVIPRGPIVDMADAVTGGQANALDVLDAANAPTFTIPDLLTVTLGASGAENLTVVVHDAGANSNLDDLSNGSVHLTANATTRNVAFLRFEWVDAFRAATGVADPADIVDATVSLDGQWGDSQLVEVRRVLQPWWDHGGGDLVRPPPVNPASGHSGPTRRWSEYLVSAWNGTLASARTPGVDGRAAGDYLGANDTGFQPDAVVQLGSIVGRTVVGGPGVTDAFRFWLANPTLDFGHAFQLDAAARTETKFRNAEHELGRHAPVLAITYRVPATGPGAAPGEVSGASSALPLLLQRAPAGLLLSFEDLGASAAAYSVYAGTLQAWSGVAGAFYSHGSAVPGSACGLMPPSAAGRRSVTLPLTVSTDQYLLVTAASSCAEGPSGRDSLGAPHDPSLLDCAP